MRALQADVPPAEKEQGSSAAAAAAQEAMMPHMMEALWQMNVLDIEMTLEKVVDKALHDRSVSKKVRRSESSEYIWVTLPLCPWAAFFLCSRACTASTVPALPVQFRRFRTEPANAKQPFRSPPVGRMQIWSVRAAALLRLGAIFIEVGGPAAANFGAGASKLIEEAIMQERTTVAAMSVAFQSPFFLEGIALAAWRLAAQLECRTQLSNCAIAAHSRLQQSAHVR
jgi:uncharacterized membrane protein